MNITITQKNLSTLPKTTGKAIVQRIDLLLHEKNLKRSNMCHDLNLKQNTISSWINRNSFPRLDIAIKISKYLKVSPEFLLTGEKSDFLESEYQQFIKDVKSLPLSDFRELQALVRIKKDSKKDL